MQEQMSYAEALLMIAGILWFCCVLTAIAEWQERRDRRRRRTQQRLTKTGPYADPKPSDPRRPW